MRSSGTKDRRRYFRHPAQIPIVCRRTGHTEFHAEQLRNIGCGGMAFDSASTFEPGNVISVDYPFLDVLPKDGGANLKRILVVDNRKKEHAHEQ